MPTLRFGKLRMTRNRYDAGLVGADVIGCRLWKPAEQLKPPSQRHFEAKGNRHNVGVVRADVAGFRNRLTAHHCRPRSQPYFGWQAHLPGFYMPYLRHSQDIGMVPGFYRCSVPTGLFFVSLRCPPKPLAQVVFVHRSLWRRRISSAVNSPSNCVPFVSVGQACLPAAGHNAGLVRSELPRWMILCNDDPLATQILYFSSMKLEANKIETIKTYFKTRPVLKAYLFGSYVRDEADQESDIDILVELDYSQRIGLQFVQMQIDLEKLLSSPVDLVSSNGLSHYIKPIVDSEKQLIYAR